MATSGGRAVQALAGICLLLFVAVCTLVGVRMLLLARRTKGLPELLMGTGMVVIAGIGYPISHLSGFGGPVGKMVVPLWIASTLLTQTGIVCIYAFNQQVFRPRDGWARPVVVAAGALMLVSLAGSAHALAGAPPEMLSQRAARGWLFFGMIGYSGCFVWSAFEGFTQHAKARRRLALGLADRVVVNRFLLWGVFGLMATGINVSSAIGNLLGVDPTRSPAVLVPMGVLGALAGAAMYLAFVPPAWYLGWLRGGARA
jgi:hypothetical protein